MIIYTALLKDHTVGTIKSDSIQDQDLENFIGEYVTVHLYDENGLPVEVYGLLQEILEAEHYV